MGADASRADIVIGGGSFAGLGLALALARSAPELGLCVIDAACPDVARARTNDGRAVALAASSVHLLSAIGVWDGIEAAAQAIRHIDITDSPLSNAVRPLLLSFDSTVKGDEPAAWMVENYLLRGALIEAARADRAIAFLAPDRVTDFEAGIAGVTVALASGARIASRLLAAADGRRSSLRRMARIKTVGWRYRQSGIIATVAHEKPHRETAVQHFLPSGPFAILPLTGERSSIVWTEAEDEARRIMGLDDAGFLEELRKRFGGKLGALALAGPRGSYPLELHLARSFVAERFALIGDAAHAVHPLAGQGLNIALKDVAALTEVAVDALRLGLDPGGAECLRRYERWRRFDSAFSGLAMDALNRLFSSDNDTLRALRSLGLGLVDRAPRLKRLFVAEAAGLTGETPRLLRGEVP